MWQTKRPSGFLWLKKYFPSCKYAVPYTYFLNIMCLSKNQEGGISLVNKTKITSKRLNEALIIGTCPSPTKITLKQRLNNVSHIPQIINHFPGLVVRGGEITRLEKDFLVVTTANETNGPHNFILRFKNPVLFVFPLPKPLPNEIIDAFIEIRPDRKGSLFRGDLGNFSEINAKVIQIGLDFIEVIAVLSALAPRSPRLILIPLNRFVSIDCKGEE